MNLNKFFQPKSEFSHAVQMVRNHIAKEHFISKFILPVSNSHERLGEAMARFDIKRQIWRHASSPCFKAVGASPKLYSMAPKSMCGGRKTYRAHMWEYWWWRAWQEGGWCGVGQTCGATSHRARWTKHWRSIMHSWKDNQHILNELSWSDHELFIWPH